MKLSLTATPSASRFAPIIFRGSATDAFELASRHGYDAIELHLRHAGDVDLAEIRSLMDRHHIVISTLGTGMAAGEDKLTLTDQYAEVRAAAIKRVGGHIQLAAELGAAVIVGLVWGRLGREPYEREAARRRAVQGLREICRLAEDRDVMVYLEAINRYESDFPVTAAQTVEVLDEVDAPNLKVLLDTFHMNIEEADIASAIRATGDRLGHMHLVDSNRQAPGHGHVDLKQVIGALREIGYEGYLSFEVLPLPDAETAAADAARTLRALLAQ